MKGNSMKPTRSAPMAALAILAILAALLSITGCEDNLTDQIKEEARLAALPEYTVTILTPTYGSVTPVGKQKVKKGEPLSVSAAVPAGYSFVNWQIVSGAENVKIKKAESASTTVYALRGNATIQPVIGDAIYSLTVTNDGHGTTDPASVASVANSQPRTITATPIAGYGFDEWVQTAGPGTATFQNPKFASTTITVTGGNATIQARFKVGQSTLTITNDGNGTTNVISQTLYSGVAGSTITATPNAEYQFTNWTVIAGSGITFLPRATSDSVTVTAISGDATIRANFAKKTYTLTFQSVTGGYSSPGGSRTVTTGTPLSINAYGYPTYTFDTVIGWTKTAGTGTVVFANDKNASTTVTVTGGNATISPKFRKYNVSLTPVGSVWTPGTSDEYPQNFTAAAFIGNYLYYAGPQSTSITDGVIRRIDFTSPTTPTSGGFDDVAIDSKIRDMIAVGTSLVIGTNANLYKIASPGTDLTVTPRSPTATPITALCAEPGDPASFWAYAPGNFPVTESSYPVAMLSLSGLKAIAYGVEDKDGYVFEKLIRLNSGMVSIQEDNGSRRLAGYFQESLEQGNTPDSSVSLYDGGDMYEGLVGSPSLGSQEAAVAVPVQSLDDTLQLRVYNIEERDGLFRERDINLGNLPRSAKCATFDHTEGNDVYVYVSGSTGSKAILWIVDLLNGEVTPVEITGYSDAPYIIEKNGYLYVFLDDLLSASSKRVAVKVYQIVRN